MAELRITSSAAADASALPVQVCTDKPMLFDGQVDLTGMRPRVSSVCQLSLCNAGDAAKH